MAKRAFLMVVVSVLAACSSGGGTPSPTCQAGQACTPSSGANACKSYVTACDAAGAQTCVAAGDRADGASCGTGNVCLGGTCIAACVPGSTCTPSGTADPCVNYVTTCDATLTHGTCTSGGTKPDGATCGASLVCSAGACVAACVPGATCVPVDPADQCRTYSTVCNTALTLGVCTATGNATDGATCYTDGTCLTGVCRGGVAPSISPAGGAYVAGQVVVITADPDAVVYYTTDGSEPSNTQTIQSPSFTGGSRSITLLSSTTIKAFAVLASKQSPTVSASFVISPAPPPPPPNPPPPVVPTFSAGFTGSETTLQRNGDTVVTGTGRLELTADLKTSVASAFFNTPVDIRRFTTEFSFQLTAPAVGALADGITFTVQGVGPYAIGSLGGGLGYGPEPQVGSFISRIDRSVAVKFDTFDDVGEGNNSTGLYQDGAAPALPADTLPVDVVNLHSGHVFNVRITYDGVLLTLNISDADGLHGTFTKSWPVNIPALVGGNTAYVGFTGATGGMTSTQEVTRWVYTVP